MQQKIAEIILVGGGGHCRSVIDVIEAGNKFRIAGIIDIPENIGKTVLGYPVIASDIQIESILKAYKNYIVTLGHIQSNSRRKSLFEMIEDKKGICSRVISPFSYVSKHAYVGRGTVVLHHAVINAAARVGNNCIVNSSSTIEHNVVLGDHCHVAPGACINGGCQIENDCFIGSKSTIIQGIRIGRGSLIAAGSVVINNVEDYSLVAGNPAVKKKQL